MQEKFNWNCFVCDPGHIYESRYPITLNTFKSMTNCMDILKLILEDIKRLTGIDFTNDELMQERVLKNYYKHFYEKPEFRVLYNLNIKACPTFLKKKILHIPLLNNENSENPKYTEAQHASKQNNTLPQQNYLVKTQLNTTYIAKRTIFSDSAHLLCHIRRHVQHTQKHPAILERIKSEVLQPAQQAQIRLKEQIPVVEEKTKNVGRGITSFSSAIKTPMISVVTERINRAKHLFFKEYIKSNTLPYLLRTSKGLKRKIIATILNISFEEFSKYTRIYNALEIYEDPKLLADFYQYAIKDHQIWPINLYMPLRDLYGYLKFKGIILSSDNLKDISPILVHWEELAALTNFDKIMRYDYYRSNGETLKKEDINLMDAYSKVFYEKCWYQNLWLHIVPQWLYNNCHNSKTNMQEILGVEINNAFEVRGSETVSENNLNPEVMAAEEMNEAEKGKNTKQSDESQKQICSQAAAATIRNISLTELILNIEPSEDDTAVQQRLQKAQEVYFKNIPNYCTLSYLLRFYKGLKRHIIDAILKMTFTEFQIYTNVFDAAEFYKDIQLLERCYYFTFKEPQIWPINLYMRLTDMFQYLQSKGLKLQTSDLKYVSPKLLHWQDLMAMTNYDHIVYWDFYRSSGKKSKRNIISLDSVCHAFYEKCWYQDEWLWYTPKILPEVLQDITVEKCANTVEEEEEAHNKNISFEKSVLMHTLGRRQKETKMCKKIISSMAETVQTITSIDAEIQASEGLQEEVGLQKGAERSVIEVQVTSEKPSQHFLDTALGSAKTISINPKHNSVNPSASSCREINEEKRPPLNKFKFDRTPEEDNYECVHAQDDIIEVDSLYMLSQSPEETLLPLSNSDLDPIDWNSLLAAMHQLHEEGELGKSSEHLKPRETQGEQICEESENQEQERIKSTKQEESEIPPVLENSNLNITLKQLPKKNLYVYTLVVTNAN